MVEVQGVVIRGTVTSPHVRTEALRALLAGLLGLLHSADVHEAVSTPGSRKHSGSFSHKAPSPSIDTANKHTVPDERASRRTKVSPDIWHDTLSLLCDKDFAVRTDYARALSFYIANEMPKHPDMNDAGPHKMQTLNKNILLHSGDVGAKFLNALHSYLFILATTSSLGLSLTPSPSTSVSASTNGDLLERKSTKIQVELANGETPAPGRPSLANIQAPRGRKVSLAFRLLEGASEAPASSSATPSDFADILDVLATVHGQLPVRGLLTGLPMLLALDAKTRKETNEDPVVVRKENATKSVLAKVWLLLGSQWDLPALVDIAEKVLLLPSPCFAGT